jgi:HD superfamily phosphohydrolase YqeK
MTGYDKAIHDQTKIPAWEDFASMNYCPNGEISKNQLLHQCVAIISTHPKYEKLVPEEVYDAIIKHTKEVYNQ